MPAEEGDRIELKHTSDPYTDLEPGCTGTVTGMGSVPMGRGPDKTQIWVDWDNGSSLALVEGEDRYRVIQHNQEETANVDSD